jgi:hypothetical protein
MTTHRFTVNVPNPSPKPVLVTLRLTPVKPGGGRAPLDVPDGPIEVGHVGLTLEPCGKGEDGQLDVKLEPLASVNVHVVVEVNASGRGGSAAFRLSDERGGRVVGGVTLVCVDRAAPEHAGVVVPSPNPCPVTLAGAAHFGQLGGDPAKAANDSLTVGTTMELVVPVTNPTGAVLPDACVYLEHLGASAATFRPRTWNLGRFQPNETFFGAWDVSALGVTAGIFRASLVALCDAHEPVRLQLPFKLGPSTERNPRTGR